MAKIMVRSAQDDFSALLTAEAMESEGANVFAITTDGEHTLPGALMPTTRYKVWAKIASEDDCDRIDEAISKALDNEG